MNKYLALIAVAALTMTAFAQPGRGPQPRPEMRPAHEALIEKLNLNETQKNQMKKLHLDLMKKQTALRSKIQTLRLEIQEQFLADKVDRAAIEKNLKAISDAQHQMKLNMLAHWFDVNAMLTPEQQKIWKEAPGIVGQRMRQGMREGMRHMMMQRRGWDWNDDDGDND